MTILECVHRIHNSNEWMAARYARYARSATQMAVLQPALTTCVNAW
jgi:hypothetical protein